MKKHYVKKIYDLLMKHFRQILCYLLTGHRLAHIYEDGQVIREWCIECGKGIGRNEREAQNRR